MVLWKCLISFKAFMLAFFLRRMGGLFGSFGFTFGALTFLCQAFLTLLGVGATGFFLAIGTGVILLSDL